MHELSLCRAIVDTVHERAGGREVSRVSVRIGYLRQVVPETLAYCWEMVTKDTDLSACALDIDHVPAVLTCRSCGSSTALDAPVLLCGSCGSRDVDLVAGDEFLVTSIDGPEDAVLESILSQNDLVADANRRTFAANGVRTVNLMSSPGAGKTMLLRRTLGLLGEQLRVGILEGDIETSLDADRLAGLGAAVSLVNTSAGFGGECHLDAVMVQSGLGRLPLDQLDLLVIENVGNLVCPAEFDVGEHAKAMVYAVTEGEEKPLKYPLMFRAVDVVVINKIDLLPHLDFDLDAFLTNLRDVNPDATVFQISARTGEGVDAWCDWLRGLVG